MRESTTTAETTFERHFSVEELSTLWGMSDDFIRRLFLHEPGVMIFCRHRPGRRVYRTLRIPESVALRVHERMRASDERRAGGRRW
jgi:transcriptional regulator GlxA family with amidase domain